MFIFAANDGNGGGKVTFVLGGGLVATRGAVVEVVSETPFRKIALRAGSDRFVDSSNAMDVAVYQLQIRSKTDDRMNQRKLSHRAGCLWT